MEEYTSLIGGIWDRIWLTNNGPLVKELESSIASKLGIGHLSFVTNGTIAIQIALKALNISGEVITTPFSYVATTSSIVWEGCEPVFADIDPDTWNINPACIENLITPRTTAILATHVFGNPCDIEAIGLIAKKHGLKVIYDGAHCFGSTYKGQSVFNCGDITTGSFHATKLFHTIEGGVICTPHPEVLERINFQRNFGHNGPSKFECVGINGKNSEFHAAMGIINLKYVDSIIEKYKTMYALYKEQLQELGLKFQTLNTDGSCNFSYFPVLFPHESSMMQTMAMLEANGIFTRRYFYPSLSELPYCSGSVVPVSADISSRILCLPFYYRLDESDVLRICSLIRNSIEQQKSAQS